MKIGMPVLYEFDRLEENFSFAAENGFDFVELNLNFSYCRKELCNGSLMSELTQKYGLGLTMHFLTRQISVPMKKWRKVISDFWKDTWYPFRNTDFPHWSCI